MVLRLDADIESRHVNPVRLTSSAVRLICRFIDEGVTSSALDLLEELFEVLGVGAAFEEATGVDVDEFVLRRRTERALSLLKNLQCDLGEVPYRAGFSDCLQFEESVVLLTGATPATYRQELIGQKGLWDDAALGSS